MGLISRVSSRTYRETMDEQNEFLQLYSKINSTIVNFKPSPKKICLQLPDKLFIHIPELYTKLSSNHEQKSFYFLADSTFGINDPDAIAAQHINADLLLFITLEPVSNKDTALQHIKFIVWNEPESKNMESIELSDREIMKRYHHIEKLKIAEIIGILIGTFSIEKYKDAVDYASTLIKNENKRPVICFMGEVTPKKLCNLPEVDIWVQICEPKSIIKDQSDFYQPITSLRELAVAFDNLDFSFKNYDFTKILPDDYEAKKRLEALQLDSSSDSEDEKTLLPAIVKSNKQVTIKAKGGELIAKSAVSNYLAERTWR